MVEQSNPLRCCAGARSSKLPVQSPERPIARTRHAVTQEWGGGRRAEEREAAAGKNGVARRQSWGDLVRGTLFAGGVRVVAGVEVLEGGVHRIH